MKKKLNSDNRFFQRCIGVKLSLKCVSKSLSRLRNMPLETESHRSLTLEILIVCLSQSSIRYRTLSAQLIRSSGYTRKFSLLRNICALRNSVTELFTSISRSKSFSDLSRPSRLELPLTTFQKGSRSVGCLVKESQILSKEPKATFCDAECHTNQYVFRLYNSK